MFIAWSFLHVCQWPRDLVNLSWHVFDVSPCVLMVHSPVATWLSSDHEKRELCGNMASLFVEGVPVSVPSAADNPDIRDVVFFLCGVLFA